MTKNPTYELYLNGNFYAKGPASYISALIEEYVVVRKMFGRHNVTFSIQEATTYGEKSETKTAEG